jgi:hypothetical protein
MLGRWGRAACSGWSDGAKAEYPVTPGGNPVHHARGDLVPRPTPRHRRKAGSGPPAAALIAWIGTDRREPDLRPSSNSRHARNVVAGVALACGAVVAVTVGTAAEVLGPRDATTPPAIPPDQPIPANQVGPNTMLPPVPAAAQSAVVRQAPQSIPVPPAPEEVTEEVAEDVAEPTQPAVTPPPVTQRQAAAPRVRSQPDAPAQRRNADVPRTSPSTRDARSGQRSPSDRGESGGQERSRLDSTLKRTTGSVESGLGVR